MLESVLAYLKNWFLLEIVEGQYIVKDGNLTVPFLAEGQYFRVFGSIFNDGLHRYGDELKDETFAGTIWVLAVPPAVVNLAEEIAAWQAENGKAAPFVSESFGGYSYTKAVNKNSGLPAGWREAFAAQLAPYRKMGNPVPLRGTRSHVAYHKPHDPDHPWG